MVPGLLIDAFGKLAKDPACLSLFISQLVSIQSLGLFAVELALELIGSPQYSKQVH